MKDFNTRSFAEQLQIPVEENTVSLLIDPDSGVELPSPDVLRSMFEISDGLVNIKVRGKYTSLLDF